MTDGFTSPPKDANSGDTPSRTHLLIFYRVELSRLLGETKSPMAMVGFEPATFRLAVECFNHSATSQQLTVDDEI